MTVRRKQATTTTAIDDGVFNREHLARYTMNSADLEREVIGLFLMQLPTTIEMIEEAAFAAEWKLAAHTLKGAAASIGAGKLHQIAVELEDGGFDIAPDVRADAVRRLKAAAAEFRDTVRHICP